MGMDPKYQQMMEEGEATVEIHETMATHQFIHPASFIKSLVLSCIVSTCCCWVLGGIAFILALTGQKSAFVGNVPEARRLKIASYIVSGIGFLTGMAILIFFTVHLIRVLKAANHVDAHLLSTSYTLSPP